MAEADPVLRLGNNFSRTLAEVMIESHRIRSQLLDCFHQVEEELYLIGVQLNVKTEATAPLGGRISQLRTAPVSDKKRKVKLDSLLDLACEAAKQRAHIVHAMIYPVMSLDTGEVMIQFKVVPQASGMCYCITESDFRKLPNLTLQLANRLKQLRTTPAPAAPAGTSATA